MNPLFHAARPILIDLAATLVFYGVLAVTGQVTVAVAVGIALGVAHLVEALGMTQGWATFLGASIGLFGADEVREWGRRIAERRVR